MPVSTGEELTDDSLGNAYRQLAVLSGNFQMAADTAVKYGLSHIEFGVIHGQYFVHGLGYDPSVSLQSNPRR